MNASDQTLSFRPRISLLTMLLLFALVACGLTIWQLWREVQPLREEVRHLRDLAGFLSVDDPKRLHAVRAQTSEPDYWRWRIHVPETITYYLHAQPEKVPRMGIPDRPNPRAGVPLKAGENVMELRLLPSQSERNVLEGRLVWHGGGSVGNWPITLKEQDQQWISNEVTGGRTDGWPATLLTTESVGPDEPLVLLRLRANDYYVIDRDAEGKPRHTVLRAFDQPCDGLMIWIDAYQN